MLEKSSRHTCSGKMGKVFLFCFLAAAISVCAGKRTAQYWIDKYAMGPHPGGGGWNKIIYRNDENVSDLPERYGVNATRSFSTHILYVIEDDGFSTFHSFKTDEIWHFYHGAQVTLTVIDHKTGELTRHQLGKGAKNYVAVIKHGDFHSAKLRHPGEGKYALVGITAAPGYDSADDYKPKREDLLKQFPQHADVIESLTME